MCESQQWTRQHGFYCKTNRNFGRIINSMSFFRDYVNLIFSRRKDGVTLTLQPSSKRVLAMIAANDRPVSLTSLRWYLLEHVIVSKTVKHLENHNILNDCQHGFRAKRTCEMQMLTLYHELASSVDKRIQTDMFILDLSKAFDRLSRQCLLKMFHHYDIRGTILQWSASFIGNRSQQLMVVCQSSEMVPDVGSLISIGIRNRSQQVMVEGKSIEKVPGVSEVPQGSVLWQILFLLFIGDLFEHINSQTRLFADDCILYHRIKSSRDQSQLQEDLDKLAV